LIASIAAIAAIGGTLLLAPRGASPAPPGNAATLPRLELVAGLGTLGYSGDGGPAVVAQLDEPIALVFDPSGALYVADSTHQLNGQGVREAYTRIRQVDGTGTIRTIAGGGTSSFPFEGNAGSARFPVNSALAIDRSGVLYVAGPGDLVSPQWVGVIGANAVLRIIAGADHGGFAGDGGPAASALLFRPSGLAADAQGTVFIVDSGNNRIRAITPDGMIDTIAGNGERAFAGDGGPARMASFYAPLGLALSGDGSLYISDTNNHRIRKIDHGGTVSTVAGTGVAAFAGDGGPATGAALNLPAGLAFDRAGNLYIADPGNDRVRKVAPDGTITTVAGGADRLSRPAAVAVGADGGLYIADTGNHRVVKIMLP